MPERLDQGYDPGELEPRLYARWEASGVFHAEPEDPGEPFVIVIPPPNVTGSLHMGHALDNTLQDVLIRRARMLGRNAVWLPGMDHAGIATQTVVERELAKDGVTRQQLGRERFLEAVWRFKEESGGAILRQLRRLGCSPDWEREAFTFDEARSRAVRQVFCDWYERGLIYRGERIINWDPKAQTAISDIEVDHEDVEGELAWIRYPAWGGGEGLVVATTRPETMLGDTAVAVHPEDPRYRHLVGTTLRLPLLDRELPVVADDAVDPEFGSGAVKVTPAHDPNDFAIAQRHGLTAIDVLDDTATVNANGGPYAGLDRYAARAKVKADLDAAGLLVKLAPHTHSVGHSSRTKVAIEPRLSEQWFVAVEGLAAQAIAAVDEGRTRFVPERKGREFRDWLANLHDWCISRQLWWGHRIPAWYDADGGIHVYREDPSPEEVAGRGLTHQDPDVLDTWFSSQLWPFTTLGWPEDTAELEAWYPTSVLVTGYDINTFWVSRMLMVGLDVMGEVPFHTVLNHGLVRDRYGKKMSKSFGNVIDPLELVEAYGADALRYALLRTASPGQDVPLAEDWVKGGRNFANKLWNAARLVLARTEGTDPAAALPAVTRLEDRWVLSRLEAARADADAAYDRFDVAVAARALSAFVWDEFCDWYLELAKLRDDAEVRAVLAAVLDDALRLLHPVIPFVTETLWQALHGTQERSVMRAPWPAARAGRDLAAEASFGLLQAVVTRLRTFRADHGLAAKARPDVVAVAAGDARAVLEPAVDAVVRLGGIGGWAFADAPPAGGPTGKLVVGDVELSVALAGLVDEGEERARLERDLAQARDELRRAESKLANAGFVAKAPEAVVVAEREKVARWGAVARKLGEQLGGRTTA